MNLDYINKVAPTHDRLSCSDAGPINARYAPDDFGGCYRCTLLAAAAPEKKATQLATPAEPLHYLCNATRFKLTFNGKKNCTSLHNFADVLEGRWVALVPAENDRHMQMTGHINCDRDLAMLCGRLLYALKKADPEHDLPAKATTYLKERNLIGSPLREADATNQKGDVQP